MELDAQFVLVIIFAMVTAIVYSVWNYITKTDPGKFEVKRLLASVIFGLFLGVITIYTASETGMQIDQINFPLMADLFVTYNGLLLYINRAVDWLWMKLFGQKVGGKPTD
jgi:hypothetical protein